MDSVLDDLENVEDINELESRLYAQIHHEAPAEDNLIQKATESELSTAAGPNHRIVTNTSVINNPTDFKSKRYWNNSQNVQHIVQRKKFENNTKNYIENENINNNDVSKLKEKTFKPFKAYESIISGLVVNNNNQQISSSKEIKSSHEECVKIRNDNEENTKQPKPFSKANITKTFKKNRLRLKKQRQRKNLQNQNLQKQEKEPEEHIQKKNKYNKKTGVGLEKDEPLVRNYLKMQKVLKYQSKKVKAISVREKNVQKPQENQILSFDLISDEDDDVIEIQVPPPPIVTINDSSEDEDMSNEKGSEENKSKKKNFVAETKESFAKPKQVKVSNKYASNNADNNSSRCASPCSVISADDFIGQADRSRLLNERIIVNDDYLICTDDNVETYIESPQDSHSNINDNQNNNLTTVRNTNNRKTILNSNDYHGTQDVYCESESESIHSKSSLGVKLGQTNTTSKPSVIIEELSSQTNSDFTEGNKTTQKIKRLRKRRASFSNKETETNNNSTDSDREETIITNEANSSSTRTTLPFITRGEAVESCKIKPLRKRSSQSSSRLDINSSDNEFINMLHTVSQPNTNSKKVSPENFSDESTRSEENLTARIIAEEILSKRHKKPKKSNDIEKDANVNNSISKDSPTFDQSNKRSNCDTPTLLNLELIEKQFDIIDKMPGLGSNSMDAILHAQIENKNINTEIETNTSTYNVIHTNSNNIGWNEEMFRFYNFSWGGENFNANLIRKKMDRKARWTIHTEDRFPKYKKYMNVRCSNCSEMGHIQSKCSQPKKPITCSMCGQTGHREPRCPNTICLGCGKKTRVFIKSCNACSTQSRLICPICKIRGHGIDFCPDKWRRYHSTIISNAQPNSTIIYNQNKFCCVCAGRGHLAEHCKAAYRFSEYPLSISQIKSHRKSYDDQKKTTTLLPNIHSYNLLYEPDDSINFTFSTNSKINNNQYYGRFLNAVGLDYIINEPNKRKAILIENSQEKRRKTTNRNILKSQETNKNVKQKNKNLVRNPMYKKNSINEGNKKVNDSVTEISENQPTSDKNKSSETQKINTNSENCEHTFKSPRILVEKSTESSVKSDMSKCEDNSQDTATKEVLNLDSDSNYSFSEHFDMNITTLTPAKISRPMEKLPDYIPLNDNATDENITTVQNLQISTDINQYSEDDTADFENTFKLDDIPCIAKIYLKKDFSDYLLSPEGNTFLVHNSNKFDVKASIDWTRVGNILVLEGLRDNQDKFHTELLLAFRSLPDKLNRKDLEKTQQVPRKRIKMIRFLSDNLRILQKSNFLSANVNLLFKQLKDYENKNSQTSWKMAEKTRRILNMILFGKIGLRYGKQNLDLLVNSLKTLALISIQEDISNEMREDINKSWKYIFSSQKHENYEELVEIYYDMKRKNIFPELKINGQLLDRNFLSLSLTEEEKNTIISDCNYYKQHNTSNETCGISKYIPKLTLDTSEPTILPNQSSISLNISTVKNNSITQSFSDFISENLNAKTENFEWENQCLKLLTQIDNKNSKNSSIYWSKQSMKFLNNLTFFYKSNQLLSLQLQQLLQKANKHLLSYDDYGNILKIYNKSKISDKDIKI